MGAEAPREAACSGCSGRLPARRGSRGGGGWVLHSACSMYSTASGPCRKWASSSSAPPQRVNACASEGRHSLAAFRPAHETSSRGGHLAQQLKKAIAIHRGRAESPPPHTAIDRTHLRVVVVGLPLQLRLLAGALEKNKALQLLRAAAEAQPNPTRNGRRKASIFSSINFAPLAA